MTKTNSFGSCKPTTPTRSACPCSRRSSTASKACSPTSTNAHAFYLACDEAHKRLCNQAFFIKITPTEDLDVESEFTGVYETVLNPTNRLHAEFWQRTGQPHPDIKLDRNEETPPTDHGGRAGTSTKWWASYKPIRNKVPRIWSSEP